MPAGIYITDKDGGCEFVNSRGKGGVGEAMGKVVKWILALNTDIT